MVEAAEHLRVVHGEHEARQSFEEERRLVPTGGSNEIRKNAPTEPISLEGDGLELLQERLQVGPASHLRGCEDLLGVAEAVGEDGDGGADSAVDAVGGGEEPRRRRQRSEKGGEEGGVEVAEPEEGELQGRPPISGADDLGGVLAGGRVEGGPVRLEVGIDGGGCR